MCCGDEVMEDAGLRLLVPYFCLHVAWTLLEDGQTPPTGDITDCRENENLCGKYVLFPPCLLNHGAH